MTIFEEACVEMAARTGLTGRELKAATYDDIADGCDEIELADPTAVASTPGFAGYLYREMARKTRSGEIP